MLNKADSMFILSKVTRFHHDRARKLLTCMLFIIITHSHTFIQLNIYMILYLILEWIIIMKTIVCLISPLPLLLSCTFMVKFQLISNLWIDSHIFNVFESNSKKRHPTLHSHISCFFTSWLYLNLI